MHPCSRYIKLQCIAGRQKQVDSKELCGFQTIHIIQRMSNLCVMLIDPNRIVMWSGRKLNSLQFVTSYSISVRHGNEIASQKLEYWLLFRQNFSVFWHLFFHTELIQLERFALYLGESRPIWLN